MIVKIKRLLKEADIPCPSQAGDCGLDLTAVSVNLDSDGYVEYCTGLAIEIPEGYAGFIFPRSSISNTNLLMANSVGIIDSNYRGEIKARFRVMNHHQPPYRPGDRIAQLVILPYPNIVFQEVDELSDTNRGTGGFGSTGN